MRSPSRSAPAPGSRRAGSRRAPLVRALLASAPWPARWAAARWPRSGRADAGCWPPSWRPGSRRSAHGRYPGSAPSAVYCSTHVSTTCADRGDLHARPASGRGAARSRPPGRSRARFRPGRAVAALSSPAMSSDRGASGRSAAKSLSKTKVPVYSGLRAPPGARVAGAEVAGGVVGGRVRPAARSSTCPCQGRACGAARPAPTRR